MTATSSHCVQEVQAIYEDISRAIHSSGSHITVVTGDFNTKLDKRDGTAQESAGPSTDHLDGGGGNDIFDVCYGCVLWMSVGSRLLLKVDMPSRNQKIILYLVTRENK